MKPKRLLLPCSSQLRHVVSFGLLMTSLTAWPQQKQIAELNTKDVVTAPRVQPLPPNHTKSRSVVVEPHPAKIPQTSLFDSVGKQIQPVLTSVEVQAEAESINITPPRPIQIDAQEILTSAGTYRDISRYLQTLPGVVGTDDGSNQMLVRGGHPLENLFLVDGIEIPNINHLADVQTATFPNFGVRMIVH